MEDAAALTHLSKTPDGKRRRWVQNQIAYIVNHQFENKKQDDAEFLPICFSAVDIRPGCRDHSGRDDVIDDDGDDDDDAVACSVAWCGTKYWAVSLKIPALGCRIVPILCLMF